MINQELQYLREEHNQRINTCTEHTSKTFNTILLVWGGALVVLGAIKPEFKEINLENTFLCFLMATIFFISSLILYFSSQALHDAVNLIFKHAAYIAVFYEKQPRGNCKIEDICCWELASFEVESKNDVDIKDENKTNQVKNSEGKLKKFLHLSKDGHILFSFISIILTGVPCGIMGWILFNKIFYSNVAGSYFIYSILFLTCVVYFVISIYLYRNVINYTPERNAWEMKTKYMRKFLQYALDKKHYTENDLKERFGVILDICGFKLPKPEGTEINTLKNRLTRRHKGCEDKL